MDEMDRVADLGTALYPSQGPSPQLRIRALAGATDPAARLGRARPLLVAGGAAMLAAGAAVAAGTTTAPGTSGGPAVAPTVGVQPAAFTVRVNNDGSVTFTARDLVDTRAATRAINQAGIAGRVVNMSTDGCASGPVNPADVDHGRPAQRAMVGWRGGSNTITVRSSDYPPGGGLLVAVEVAVHKADGRVGIGVLALAFKDAAKVPACVTLPAPAPSTTGPS